MATNQRDKDAIDHALDLMASLKELKEERCICDFIVQVGGDSFPVHRSVLAACSGYFKAMFSHGMKEEIEGSVDLKGLTVSTVKACIEYMYTGKAGITLGNVTDILHASTFMQMDKLSEKCFKFLSSNITPESCLTVMMLAELYENERLFVDAEKYLVDQFASVSLTQGFLNVDLPRLLHYIQKVKADYFVLWKAVMAWTKHDVEGRKKKVFTLLRAIKIQNSPPKFLLQTAWREPLVQRCETCKSLITQAVFSRPELFEGKITIDTISILKAMASKYKPANAKKVIVHADEFLMAHFEGIAETPVLATLAKEDIIMLLGSDKTNFSSETVKWNAAMKWLKHDARRKSELLEIMKLIKFQNMSLEFIQNKVRREEMVAKCPECKDFILDALLLRPAGVDQREKPSAPAMQPTGIAIFDKQKSELIFFDISRKRWRRLSSVQEEKVIGIVNVAGKLYLVSHGFILQMQRNYTWKRVDYRDLVKAPIFEDPSIVACRDAIHILHRDLTLRYLPESDKWLSVSEGCGVFTPACASLHGNVYAFGGGCWFNEVSRLTVNTVTWLRLASADCVQQWGSADTLSRKIVYIFRDYPTKLVHRYDPLTTVWDDLPQMNYMRQGAVACVVNNRLYAVGGAVNHKGEKLTPDSIEVFDEQSNKWTVYAQMPKIEGKFYACPY